jgi:type III pantothenate kinase
MDINLLVINVGNSRVAFGAFIQGELVYTRRLPVSQRGDFEGAIVEAWGKFDGNAAEVAGASVNPAASKGLEHAVQQATGQPVQWVGRDLDLPIEVKTENPVQTGVDRVLTVAAAFEQMQKPCVVVDAGTAITVNACDEKGALIGGAIAPGARLSLLAMREHTSRLPEVTLATPAGTIGKNTEQAMLHGVYSAARGLVKEVVENYATELGTWPDIICTGGDAELLFGGWELVHAVSPDLVLYGIALAYTEHYIKHDL